MDDINSTTQDTTNEENLSQVEEVKTADIKTKVSLKDHLIKLKKKISGIKLFQRNRRFQVARMRDIKIYYVYFAVGIAVILIIVALLTTVARPYTQKITQASSQPQIANALATEEIGKTFEFPFKDNNNKEIGKIKYTIEKAELRNQIYIKGAPANALKGKTFFIVNLKLKNDTKLGIKMNTRDYIRLSINNNQNEWLAPNIHNDPAEVQAQSTENTRLGFIISATDSNLLLRVGEIDGVKETIKLRIK